MANIVIDIASEFTGAKAFKQAETSTQKLTSGVKKLAGAIGLAYGTTQILAFGKASVKAAAADEKAQKQLALALNNVGLGRDAASSEAYIQRLQSEFGILDDKLRPSYQTLAIATRDSAEAQRLMSIALDVSAANSLDLNAVTKALSRAYLGNNTALSRLQVGISKADLKTKSFKEITDQLSTTFAGSATTAASGYQGSLDRLSVATENFKESIGVGLIEALNILNGEQGLAKTTSEMDKLGIKLQNATIGAAYFVDELKKIPGGSFLTSVLGKTFGDPLGIKTLINEFEKFKQQPRPFATGMSVSGQTQTKAVNSSQIKVQKEILKANKESLKLAKARATFDLQKIQIEAALKGKISEEDAIRLKLMKAIEEENLTNVEKYQKALEVAQTKSKELNDLLAAIKTIEIKDPFGLWKIDPLTASINELTKSMFSVQTQIQANGREWSSFASTVGSTVIKPNLTEFTSSFGAAGSAATAAVETALKAQQDSLNAQTKAAQDALTAGSKAQQDAFAGQLKAQQDALTAQSSAQLAALKARLADEAAAYKEAADAAAALFDATGLLGTNDSATRNAGMLALQAAEQAKAAAAALAAADAALANNAGNATGGSKVEITVNTGVGDPNAIAEAIQQVLIDAQNRGTLDLQAIA
jgi:hypothetical protein